MKRGGKPRMMLTTRQRFAVSIATSFALFHKWSCDTHVGGFRGSCPGVCPRIMRSLVKDALGARASLKGNRRLSASRSDTFMRWAWARARLHTYMGHPVADRRAMATKALEELPGLMHLLSRWLAGLSP